MKSRTCHSLLASCAVALALLLGAAPAALAQYPSVSGAPSVTKAGKGDVALIVAVEDYAFLPDVDGAITTGNDWETYFRKGLGIDTVYYRANGRATREDILKFAKRAAKDVGKDGTLWFVYVGHGAPAKDGKDGLVVGADAQGRPSSLKARGVPRTELLEALGAGKQKRTVAVFDACFSGKSSPDTALAKGLQPVVPTDMSKTDESTLVLAAAAHDQYAGALPGAARPAFSYVLLGALRGWADDGDGEVTAAEALNYTRRQLRYLDHDQTPQLSGNAKAVLVRGARAKDPGLGHYLTKAMRSTTSTPTSSSSSETGTSKSKMSSNEKTGAAYYQRGAAAYRNKNYQNAQIFYLRGCKAEHGPSCAGLGALYSQGIGVKKNDAMAVKYYKYACTKDEREACFLVGFHYQRGEGVSQDHLKALSYLEKACELDQADACSGISGMFYNTGLGVKPDLEKASSYGKKACRLGAPEGCYYAGFSEADRQNYGVAAKLYKKGCDGGSVSACTNLGNLYLRGNGVTQNAARARQLYHKACKKGGRTACENLRVLQE